MSDEEEDMVEEEVEAEEAPKPEEEEPQEEEEEAPVKQEEEKPKPKPPPPRKIDDEDAPKEMSEAEKVMAAQRKKHDEEEALKMLNYEEKRRIEKEREDEELRQLKEKQARRQQEREEEERIMAERRREEEERRKGEEEERKKKAEADKLRKEEEKKKRQAMMAGLQQTGVTLEIPKKDANQEKFDKFGNIVKAKAEMGETKEQHEEHKRKALQAVLGEPNFSGLDINGLRQKIKDMHARITKLEAARYDLEKRKDRQEYDLKELNERQRQMHRNKALKKGLNPDEAASSRHPPKMPVASKYDRQIDRRSYGDRRYIFESDKTRKQKAIFHGSARPPNEWGRHESEELEQLRKNMEPPKYVEAVKIEGARPPMNPVPVQMPAEEAAEDEEE